MEASDDGCSTDALVLRRMAASQVIDEDISDEEEAERTITIMEGKLLETLTDSADMGILRQG